MVQAFLKRNRLLIVTVVVYVGAVVGMALVIDANVYQSLKREMFWAYNPNELFPNEASDLDYQKLGWYRALSGATPDNSQIEPLKESCRSVIRGPSSIYRIIVQDGRGTILFDEQISKFRQFNDFSNSLWLSNFTVRRGFQWAKPEAANDAAQPDERKNLGSYYFYFTTMKPLPPDLRRQIEDLTFRYRMITLLIAGALTLATYMFMRRVLLPMRNVTSSIEASTRERTRFIPRPASRLEGLYNGMARDALLLRLQEHLGEKISGEPPAAAWDVVCAACEYLVQQNSRSVTAAFELRLGDKGSLAPSRKFFLRGERASRRIVEAELEAALAPEFSRKEKEGSESPGAMLKGNLSVAVQSIDDPEREDIRYVLALASGARSGSAESEAETELLARMQLVLDRALESLLERQRSLERERGRASINLSRNLGHDLTNIIARSKLELMTLESLLGNGAAPTDGERKEILTQTLRGLLDSTRFMQEVVNLYRAYAFLKRPILEEHDVNGLVREAVQLYRLMTSQSVNFDLALDTSAPRCRMDSRLVKLALFNLFSNALDAIRKSEKARGTKGEIKVTTETSREGALVISVEDNGTGILNEHGERAEPAEIERIFALGFSLAGSQEGEGLGLNWVRTIVQEVHGGSVRAENAPSRGARFVMTFPSVEARLDPNRV